MPVHFFTFHAHGSWTPERTPQRGLFEHERFAGLCEQQRVAPAMRFTADHQRKLVDAVIDVQASAGYRCFGVSADRQRVHVLAAWEGARSPAAVRRRVASAVTRAMTAEFGARAWLSETGRDKRVRNRTHFDYLVRTFFPKQRGLMWTYAARGPVSSLPQAVASARRRAV